jgi:hypothetical protein
MSPWSSSLGLNYGSCTIFSVKKSAVSKLHFVFELHIHRYKNWFSRFGRFCYNSASTSTTVAYRTMSLSISHCDSCDMPVVAQPLRELPTLPILFFAQTSTSLWSIFCGCGSSRNGCATFGISQPSQCDMPMNKRLSRPEKSL